MTHHAAVETQNANLLADARAQVWTGLLQGGYAVVEKSIGANDTETAQSWLTLREFRRATKFSRPNADATTRCKTLHNTKLADWMRSLPSRRRVGHVSSAFEIGVG